jgi:shikimate kinase
VKDDAVFARRTLALWGFMAVGKSSVGRALAGRCGAAFVDVDSAIEEAAGRTVSELFSAEGEARFREREAELLDGLLAEPADHPRVIALGGGALLDADRRRRALDRWLVIALESRPEILVARTRGSARPLLAPAGDDERARARLVADLLKERQAAYAAVHFRASSDGMAADELAEELARRWTGWR